MLITRLLKHFGLRQPASAPYAVVAHLAGHPDYLVVLSRRLLASGDQRSRLLAGKHPSLVVSSNGASVISGSASRQMVSLYGSLEGMLEALEAVHERGASRLWPRCSYGTCLDDDA